MSESTYVPFDSAGWSGVVQHRWADRLGVDPLQTLSAAPSHMIRDRPTAQTLLVWHDSAYLFVKHMTGRKDRAGGLRRRWHQWLYRIRSSPAMNTLRITSAAEHAGVPMPAVILAVRRRTGNEIEDLLILEAIAGRNVRTRIYDATDDAARLALAEHVGRSVAHLHQAGFIHGDLLLGNLVMLDDDSPIHFVDNERTCRGRRWADRRRNLFQLTFRMLCYRRYGMALARRMLVCYTEAMGYSPRLSRRIRLTVLRRTRRRFVRDFGSRSARLPLMTPQKQRGPQVPYDLHLTADDHR